jgi:hypothetical protein
MTEPKLVQIQIAAPKGSFEGSVAIAYYVISDDKTKVTLTDRTGLMLHDAEGKECSRTLAKGDNPHQVAALLLRGFRTKVRGDRVSGFDRPLNYPRAWRVPC